MAMKIGNRMVVIRSTTLTSACEGKITLGIPDRDARLITLKGMGFPGNHRIGPGRPPGLGHPAYQGCGRSNYTPG